MSVVHCPSITASEAVCESYGSKMEVYHRWFTNGDLDDTQVQAEFRVSELGPPVGTAGPLIRRVMWKFNKTFTLTDYAKFKGTGKVITRKKSEKSEYPW